MTRARGLICLGAVLALSSVAEPRATAYRTAADLPEFSGTPRVRWPVDTIYYELAASLPPGLDAAATEQAIASAFTAWTDLPCPTVTFIYDGITPTVATSGDGRITVQWIGNDWIALGFSATAAAATDVRYEPEPSGLWRITDADIFLNSELFTWSTSSTDPTTRDVQAVLTHEVGHALGLLHPCEPDGTDGAPACASEHAGVCMHPEYSLGQRTLAEDDIAGACFLYDPPACSTAGCAAGEACTPEGCATVCDDIVCAVGDRCGPTGCTFDPCPPGSCERGCDDTCQTPGGAIGDPCASSLDCYTAHCSAGGYCAPLCDEGQCPIGFTCDGAATSPECVADHAVFGDACVSGDDCLSGQCLIEDHLPKMCTRPCGPGARDCPDGFACQAVEGVDVCVPPAESGCTIGPQPRRGSRPSDAWVLLLAVAFLVAWRAHEKGWRP